MAYSEIAFAVGIEAFVVGIITMNITISLRNRYKKKPQRATLYVLLAMLSWSILVFSASFIYLFSGMNLVLGQSIQVIMYGSILLGVFFFYMFARETFFIKKSKFYLFYVILGIFLIVMLGITESSDVESFPDSIDGNYPAIILKTEYGMMILAYCVPTFVVIVISAFRVASRLEEKLFTRGFQVIGLGFTIALGSMACDTVATLVITDAIGYALTLYVQWIFDLSAVICLYVGWTMPRWFQRMYNVKTGHAASIK